MFSEVINKKRDGFTLIEIMIVVSIIAILLAIAIPNFIRSRESSRAKACMANLRQIETAKEQWAMNNKKNADSTPTAADLVDEFMKGPAEDTLPECPAGGTYTIGSVNTRPTCSVGTNGTAADYDNHVLN
jgi:prepilin-type N-terminal cleavage/methylation domain-containing protein